ncbi:MAG: hypothetical protein AVDCRST_MAG86-514 [uncultured Truepera sp.]|uniref:Uncharacterized protein n=1 Tax=uncultured Truepera sp. TaxID=543023 RepID=A0A6J4UQI7_9DEIN|nr:MAG: hypothetical protein AVDCRST_MAG86-514 [uncultured Truepera sp.]
MPTSQKPHGCSSSRADLIAAAKPALYCEDETTEGLGSFGLCVSWAVSSPKRCPVGDSLEEAA